MSRKKWERRYPLHSDERTHYVYRAYDANGVLLYVGCTYRPKGRMKDHRSARNGDSKWYQEMTSLRFVGPYCRDEARAIEAEVIANERPLHNIVVNRSLRRQEVAA